MTKVSKMPDWNIKNHRHPHDTDEEWHVMSEFMTAHKSRLPESRLVCLAQILKNVLFYKCKYPAPVMEQIDSLSKGIKDRYSAKRKGLLTRHFVGASDASKQSFEAKSARNAQKLQDAKVKKSNLIQGFNFVKGTNENAEEKGNQTKAPTQNTGAGKKRKLESEEAEEEEETKTESTSGETATGKKKKKRRKKKKNNLNANNEAENKENEAEADSAAGENGEKMKSENKEADVECEEKEETKTESTVGQTPTGKKKRKRGKKKNKNLNTDKEAEKEENEAEADSAAGEIEEEMKSEKEETQVDCEEEENKTESTGQTPTGKKKRKRNKKKKKNLNANNEAEEKENGTEADTTADEIGEKMISESEETKVDSEKEEEVKTESPSVETTPGKKKKNRRKKKKKNLNPANEAQEKENAGEGDSSTNGIGSKRKITGEDASPSKKIKAPQGIFKPVAFQSSGVQAVTANQTQPVQQSPQKKQANNTKTIKVNGYPTEQTEAIYNHLGNIVLYDGRGNSSGETFNWVCSKNQIKYDFGITNRDCCLRMKGKEILSLPRNGRTPQEIKNALTEEALRILRHKYYTINVKRNPTITNQISREEISNVKKAEDQTTVSESSVGFKLLKMMGWSGGGLGKDQSGITEPIRPIKLIGRSGLGAGMSKADLEAYVRQLMGKLAKGEVEEDYIFSPEFTKEERAKIHRMANNKRIKTQSYGKGNERFLVVSSRITQQQFLERLLKNGDNERYSVTPPEN